MEQCTGERVCVVGWGWGDYRVISCKDEKGATRPFYWDIPLPFPHHGQYMLEIHKNL